MQARSLIICCWLIIMAGHTCVAKQWRGIVPLESTRTDVERLLGPSKNEIPTYYLPDETVYVEYAPTDEDDLRVAPGTVVSISVIPKKTLRLSDLGLDLRKFTKRRGAKDVVEDFIYFNEQEGFSVQVAQGVVSRFLYEPTKQQYQRLRNRTRNKPHPRLSKRKR